MIERWRSLAFLVVCLSLGACAPRLGPIGQTGVARSDSGAIDRRARAAVDSFERLAFAFWPPSAERCSAHRWNCYGGYCLPGVDAPCVLGRERPCPINWPGLQDGNPDRPVFPFGRDSSGYCVEHQTDARPARPSVAQVLAAREHLSAVLAAAAVANPASDWIAGQRVYYLLAEGQPALAIAAARECSGSGWWCAALLGLSWTRAENEPAATAAFASALAQAPQNVACHLNDISTLFDSLSAVSGVVKRYLAHPCGSNARAAEEARFWWLSDPSWLMPGNDRRVEHLARGVEALLDSAWGGTVCPSAVYLNVVYQKQNAVAGIRQCKHLTLITRPAELIRGGRNDAFWNVETASSASFAHCVPNPVGHLLTTCATEVDSVTRGFFARDGRARYHFVPGGTSALDPGLLPDTAWDLTAGPPQDFSDLLSGKHVHASQMPERHTPPYASVVIQLRAFQLAFFRRGASALLVSAMDVPADAGGEPTGGLPETAKAFVFDHFGATGLPTDSATMQPARRGTRWLAVGTVPWDSLMYGFEHLFPTAAHQEHMERLRLGAFPPVELNQRLQLSDVLLYLPGDHPPASLEGVAGAASVALGTTALGKLPAVGLFWETYGLVASEHLTVTITVAPQGAERSTMSRLLGLMGGRSPTTPVSVSLDLVAPDTLDAHVLASGWGHGVTLNVAGLPAGRYVANLVVSVPGQRPVLVSRLFSTGL